MDKSEIQSLISSGKTSKAIELLNRDVHNIQDEDVKMSIINVSNRFRVLKNKIRDRTISTDDADIKMNQINISLLEILSDVEISSPSPPPPPNPAVEILSRIERLNEKKRFFEREYDFASDAAQKFKLKKDIEELEEEINNLKTKLV